MTTVTVYENFNYGGRSLELAPGKYNIGCLLVVGNDSISSIKMTDGITLIAYSDMDFSGDTKILTSSSPALTDFNDTISSIIVLDKKEAAVFADGYYQGNHQILRPGKYYFKDLTVGNDTISSILMSEGLRMVLYEHDFAGTTKTITSSTPFLSDFNDVVSSVYLSEQNISAQTSPPRAEKTHFDVILKSAGAAKLGVVARGKELTGLGLKEAKDLVDGAPKPIREGVLKVTAESIKAYLTDAGAEVEVK